MRTSTDLPWRVSPDGESSSPKPCPCCGARGRTVWGYIYDQAALRAVYYAQWVLGQSSHALTLLISAGSWEEDSSPQDRAAVGLECRSVDNQTELMLIDAAQTPWGAEEILGDKLTRREVVGTELASLVFDLAGQILIQDTRIKAILEAPTSPESTAS